MRWFAAGLFVVLVASACGFAQSGKAPTQPREKVWYKIVPRLNKVTNEAPKGFVLDVCDAKVENRNPVVLCEDTGNLAQQFKFVPVDQ
jgi:hypothetical protein